jgi:hypothetical protein
MLHNETYLFPRDRARVLSRPQLEALLTSLVEKKLVSGPFTLAAGPSVSLPFQRYGELADQLLGGKSLTLRKLMAAVPKSGNFAVGFRDLVQGELAEREVPVLFYALDSPARFQAVFPEWDENFREIPGTAHKECEARYALVVLSTDSDGTVARLREEMAAELKRHLGPIRSQMSILA